MYFATADEPERPAFDQQRERFEAAWGRLKDLGITTGLRHAGNSAAILRDERVFLAVGIAEVRTRKHGKAF